MSDEKRCESPACIQAPLVFMQLESTWNFEHYYCSNPKCGRIYIIPTTTGKITQVAPLAGLGIFAVSLFTMNWERTVEIASDYFNG